MRDQLIEITQEMVRVIIRGGLSGLVGSLLYLIGHALNEMLRLGYVPYGGAMELMALPYVALAGTVCGTLIGFLLWAITNKLDLQLPGFLRAILGILILLFSWVVLYLYWGPSETGLLPRPLINQFIEGALGLTLLGALPGVSARPKLLHKDAAELAKCRLIYQKRLQSTFALLTLVVALFLTALVLRVHGHAPPGIKDHFGVGEEIFLSVVFFVIPASLVCVGSYSYATRPGPGAVIFVLGCVLVVVSSILFFVFTPFVEIFPWTWLNIFFLFLAVLTFGFWLKTRRQPHEVSDGE